MPIIQFEDKFIKFTAEVEHREIGLDELNRPFTRDFVTLTDLIADGTYRRYIGIKVLKTEFITIDEDNTEFDTVLSDEFFEMTTTPNDQIIAVTHDDKLKLLVNEFSVVISIVSL